MSRTFPCLCIAGAVMLTASLGLRGEDKNRVRVESQLSVHKALGEGREHIKRAEYEQAVAILEQQLGLINGNREYLVALRDAYSGYLAQLQSQNRLKELKTYQGRLAILEPAARPSRNIGPTARGKIDEKPSPRPISDPFHPSNGKEPDKARALVDQATSAFEKKQYESAAGLYERAYTMSPESVANSGEAWAYCTLFAINQRINRREAGDRTALEKEIRTAVGKAPQLEAVANKLLDRLKQPTAPAAQVKHTPRQNGNWARAETTNFRIFHTSDESTAERIAQVAEATRVNMTRKWFDQEPANWSPRCDLYVYPTGQGYAKATGAPATAPGHSTIKQENGRVIERRIDLRGDDPNFLAGVLPHETTHVVLAGRFGTHYVPRWADEGMAVLSEPRDRVNMHLRNLPKHQRDGAMFRVSELMRLADYPEARRVGPFYAQSVSLVDFLCTKKDPVTFARFLRESLDTNPEAALRRHFGYASCAELERDWMTHAFGNGAVANLDK